MIRVLLPPVDALENRVDKILRMGMIELVGAAAPVKAPVWGPPQQP